MFKRHASNMNWLEISVKANIPQPRIPPTTYISVACYHWCLLRLAQVVFFSPYSAVLVHPKNNAHGFTPDGKVLGGNMGPYGADRTQVGPMLAPWTLLSGTFFLVLRTGRFRPHPVKPPWIIWINSPWPRDAIRRHRFGSTLAQLTAWFLTAPSLSLNQCWQNINESLWHSIESNFTWTAQSINQ